MEYKNTVENMAAQRLAVRSIACSSCVNTIESAVMKLPEIEHP